MPSIVEVESESPAPGWNPRMSECVRLPSGGFRVPGAAPIVVAILDTVSDKACLFLEKLSSQDGWKDNDGPGTFPRRYNFSIAVFSER